MIQTILLIMMKRSMFLDQGEAKAERRLGTTCQGMIMMKRSMVLDQGEAKDERRRDKVQRKIIIPNVRIITYCIINPMYRVLSVGNYLLPYLLLHVIMPSILE